MRNDRRRFLLTSLAGALAAPLATEAQQAAKIWRIGVLTAHPSSAPVWVAFQQALRELGYVEGKNIVVKYEVHRLGDKAHLQTSAKELVAAGVDVIVVSGANAQVLAAKAATTTLSS